MKFRGYSGYRQFIFEYKYIFIHIIYVIRIFNLISTYIYIHMHSSGISISYTYKEYICKTLIYSNFLSSYKDCFCGCNPRQVFKLYIGILLLHPLTHIHTFLNQYCINIFYSLLLFSSFKDSYRYIHIIYNQLQTHP